MASQEINSSLCSSELATWHEHYDLMVESIKDSDALAEAACRAKLISTDMKNMIVVYGCFQDAQAKTRSLLNIIAEKVKSHSTYFHLFLAVLRNFPALNQLASRLQASYDGSVFGTPVVNDQEAGDHEEDELNAEHGDNDSEAESSTEVHGDDHEQDQSIEEVDVERNSSDSETSSYSPEHPSVVCEPEQSSGEESITEEEDIYQQQDKRQDQVLSDGDLGKIADSMYEWEGPIAEQLKLSPADVAAIKVKHPGELKLQTRAALRIWRQRHGSSATYNNLIKVFKQAGYNDYVLCVMTNAPTDADNSSGNLNHTPPPSARLSSSQSFTSPQFATTSTAVPLKEDQQGEENAFKEVTMTLAAGFYSVGVALGLPPSELNKIRQNCPRDCDGASEAGEQNPALAQMIAAAHQASRKRQQSNDEGIPRPKQPHIEDGPLVKFRPKLADFYSKKPEVPKGTWPPVKKTHFINLALIKQTAINFAKDYVRQTVHGSIDDIIKDKEQIDYKDAFADLEDGALVLMEGRPGCGKTTLMHKLSQDWEKREILASCLFFLVHFRRFGNRSDIELSDILRASTMDYTDEEIKELCTCIEKDSGRGVVFALDGLDEYCPKSKQNLLYNLIKRERLSNAIVIVASRPAASQKFRKYATKYVEVLGFLKPQIQEYIEGYFCECPDKAESLLRYLDHRLNVMHMCYLPLHSAMVTYLYDIEGANLPQTETEIYRHFTLWTLIRSIQKRSDDPDEPFILNDFGELSPDDRIVFNLILKLAFNATIESKQVFTLKEVREQISEQLPSSGSGNDGDSLGLIVIDRYFVKYGLDEIYTFLHLTFQEFLCAYYIANQTEDRQKEILETHASKENLAEVWKFFCGVGKCSSENFSILLRKARCKVQAEKNHSRKIVIPNTSLHLHCAYESQKEWMCSQIIQQCSSRITLRDQSLTPSDMTALGYVIRRSEMPLKELNITMCHLGVEGLITLLTEIGDQNLPLEKLSFSGTKIKQEMAEKFAAFLTVCSSVEDLDLSSCVSKSTLTDISKKVHELSSLTTLNISSNRLGNTADAVKAFIDKLPKLQTLKVHLYKDGQWYVSMKKNGQLNDISVKMCVPRNELELPDLATCTELNLYRLKITDKEAEVIGERLKECTNLSQLNLYKNQIGDTGAQSIAEGCKLCPNLQVIHLGSNSITDASVPHLVGLMETARKLKLLSLGRNQFTEAGRSQLRQAQEKRNNDTTNNVHLDLSWW